MSNKVPSRTNPVASSSRSSSRFRKPASCSDNSIVNKKTKKILPTAANSVESVRPKRRSFTRSPTPIKYKYDIYQKRSPTFGRRCPVLNRKRRASTPRQINKDDEEQDPSVSVNSVITMEDRETTLEPSMREKSQKRTAATNKSTKFFAKSSYFQHDNRSSYKNNGKRFYRTSKSVPIKRRWKSPARWQHDLFDEA